MSTINMHKEIKKIHRDYLIIIKRGTFYEVYGNDAYILNHMFDYKLKFLKSGYETLGFGKNALNKVINGLNTKKINYLVLDKLDGYEILSKKNFSNFNKYKAYLTSSIEIYKRKIKIEELNKFLIDNIERKKMKKLLVNIYKNINEYREIFNN